ncbi:MAG: thioredoxin family protein [Ferruginibacter sp.]
MNYLKLNFLVGILAIMQGIAIAQTPSAEIVLKKAYSTAEKEHKNVIVIFHASWCGWCHKMDSCIYDKSCSKLFADNYIICHLTVDESKGKEQLENPGASEFRKKYNGDKVGIPFFLIFNGEGKLLADSKMRTDGAGPDEAGENMGCPASKAEVAYFVKVLKQTSRLTDPQLDIIAKRFRQNERN